jgi:ribosome-associated toxin RatA of RatAB toxin-antitoxin module
MNTISRKEFVKFSPKQMYDLVNNVNQYHEFIPWCTKSIIIDGEPKDWMIAKLTFNFHGIQQSFTTRNQLEVNIIRIQLVDGPFEHLDGTWSFNATSDGCEIALDMNYKFVNSWLSGAFEPAFKQVSELLIDSFKDRAYEVYSR